MIFDSRDGEIMRTRSSENRDVNDVWLCDKGWFGYEFTNSNRLQEPLIRKNGKLTAATWDEALDHISGKMKAAIPGGKLAAFGGNPLTVEENDLFQQLMRKGAQVQHIDHRIGTPHFSLDREGLMPGMEISIGECETLSHIVLLGVDLTEEFPLIWLRLKQAINRGAQVYFAGHYAPKEARYFAKRELHAPGRELEAMEKFLVQLSETENIRKGALFVGRQYLAVENRARILSELNHWRLTHPQFSLNVLEGRNNSMGARIAGMRPDLGPLGEVLKSPGMNAYELIENAAKSDWDFLYVAGANPATKFPAVLWKEARAHLKFLVVQDLFLTETAQQADVVLPALSYAEKWGTFINIEGRIRKLQPGKFIPENLLSDGDIFKRLAERLDVSLEMNEKLLDALKSEFVHHFQAERKVSSEKPASFEIHTASSENRLLASFAYSLFDQGVRMQHNTHLAQSVKKPYVRLHPSEALKRNIGNQNLVTVTSNTCTIEAIAHLDEGVALGTLVLPLGFTSLPVFDLSPDGLNGIPLDVTIYCLCV